MADLLIHSLAEFREVIEGVLATVEPAHIVEVGAESGRTTEMLSDWAVAHRARLTTVDPSPADRVRTLAARVPSAHRLLTERSPAALVGLDAAQLYLLDGDHNYWTVANELRHIRETTTSASVMPVVLAHDVGWPCARRDQYYDPSALPPEAVHPHTFTQGVHPEHSAPIDGGFVSNGHYARALVEGGPKNGVLTALEDFLAESPGWELHIVPAVFGLGVLFPSAHPRRAELLEVLRPYAQNPLVARLEENRLRNWVEVLMLLAREELTLTDLHATRAHRDALGRDLEAVRHERALLHSERDAARTERDQLAARLAEVEQRLAEVEQRHQRLAERWYAKAGTWVDSRRRR